jgi:cell wall assembly regulator SMI1
MTYSRFRHLAIERARPAPTAAEISSIETLLGASLPTSFVEFLAVANGGYLEYAIDVPMDNGSTESLSFCGIFSTDDGTFCDETFVGEIRSGREYAQIPQGVLPFARDGGGSMVYLDLSPEGKGRVVAFVTGLPAWAGKRQESTFITLASSFDGYVEKLYIDREAVLDHLEHDATEASHLLATEEWLDIGLPTWRSDGELVKAIEDAHARVSEA